MSAQGNNQRLHGSDLILRREEMRRQQGGSLRERLVRGIVLGTGSVLGYEVAVLQPDGTTSTRTWDNVIPVDPVAEFEADDRVMLVWREHHEFPQILSGGGGGGSGVGAEFLFTVAYFGG